MSRNARRSIKSPGWCGKRTDWITTMPSSFCSRPGCSCTFRSLTVCCSSRWRTSFWFSHFREAPHESVLRIFRRRPASVADAPGISLSPSFTWLLPTSRTAGHRGRFVCRERPLLRCPEGTSENSPAFQRWVVRQKVASPEGTAETCLRRRTKWRGRQVQSYASSFSRPFGTCVPCGMFPGVKTPGYSQVVPPGQGNGSMKEQLPSPEFNSGQYERPNQNWICGKAAEGKPCRIGPNAKGRCRAACECQPALEIKAGETKGRYRCTRSTEYGGPCETGPRPNGACSRPIPNCVPQRSLRAKRKIFTI